MKTHKLMQLIKDNAQKERATVRAEAAADGTHIYVYDVIDSFWGVGAADLLKALGDAGDTTVHLHINSPGGDVFEARAMAAAIVACPNTVVAHIDGVCASAATYLALSGNEVRMTDGGLFMVHNSWTMAMGDCNELRQTADLLQKIDGTIQSDYCKKTGASAEKVTAWMDAETWFTAQEAMDAGFIDAIDANSKKDAPADKWNLSAYANAPVSNAAKGKPSIKPLNITEADFIAAMLSANDQCVKACTSFILTNPQDQMRDYAESCLEDCAGDLALLQVWQAVGVSPDGEDDIEDSAKRMVQINQNRMRLLAQKRI